MEMLAPANSEWLTIKIDGSKAACLCWKLRTQGINDYD